MQYKWRQLHQSGLDHSLPHSLVTLLHTVTSSVLCITCSETALPLHSEPNNASSNTSLQEELVHSLVRYSTGLADTVYWLLYCAHWLQDP